ncbi:LacI family DNA-binding transcriptional regulator [Piscinibacter sakaiensis]|uniref:LacI family DNA-binding transcriptional regulator n=1 Tax=Piscinibacter sakaiensis TaxID=1547922 RepID=UPI003AADAACE
MKTIQDVAALAGVSVSTVSNVLNDREARMRPETLARVKAAIAELGFRPNHSARMLKTGHMPMIGLMVPTIANPFFGVLARWVEEAAQARGYGVLLCNTYRNAQRERDYAEAFMAQGVRGVILGAALIAQEHLVPLIGQGLAAVSLDRGTSSDGLLRDSVSVDNGQAGAMAAEHLIGLGHKRITFVTAASNSVNRVARQEGAQLACMRAGVEFDVHVGSTDGDFNENEMVELGCSAAVATQEKGNPATALIGVNDMVAIGLLAGLRRAGVDVPRQVSVIGIDGLFLGNYVSPPLATVAQPMEAIAQAAVEHLLNRMMRLDMEPRQVIFSPELLVRSSTGPAPGSARRGRKSA